MSRHSAGKYIVGELKEVSVEAAICFDQCIPHKQFINLFERIDGAGFFHIDLMGTVSCFGESVGLGVKSYPEDLRFILRALGKT